MSAMSTRISAVGQVVRVSSSGFQSRMAATGVVGNMICWNRETVIAMRQRVETSTGMDWQVALCRTSSFSEYMLYGIFVREERLIPCIEFFAKLLKVLRSSVTIASGQSSRNKVVRLAGLTADEFRGRTVE